MSHGTPGASSPWHSVRTLERFISVSAWALCAGFIWAGIRALASGAGITMMVIALMLCAATAVALPHLKHAAFRLLMSGDHTIDEEWRRFNRRG